MYCCWEAQNRPTRPAPPSSISPDLPPHLSCHPTSAVLKNGQLLSIPLISLRLSIPSSLVERVLGQFTSKSLFPTARVSEFCSGSVPFAHGLHCWLSSTRPTPAAHSPTSAQQELMSRTSLSTKGRGKLAGKTGVIPVAEGARSRAAHIKKRSLQSWPPVFSPASLLHPVCPALGMLQGCQPSAWAPRPEDKQCGFQEGRAARKGLPPRSVRGCAQSFLRLGLLPASWDGVNRGACLGWHESGDKDESHTQGKWKNPTCSPR